MCRIERGVDNCHSGEDRCLCRVMVEVYQYKIEASVSGGLKTIENYFAHFTLFFFAILLSITGNC